MKAITALKVAGKEPPALGIFFSPSEVQPGGYSMGVQHWPLLLVGCSRALGGDTPLLDVMEYPVCEMGQQWLCKALCC